MNKFNHNYFQIQSKLIPTSMTVQNRTSNYNS